MKNEGIVDRKGRDPIWCYWIGAETPGELESALAWRLLAFWAFVIVLVEGGLFKVDSHDVGERRKPSDDVCKLFLGGFPVGSFFKFFAQFADFVDQPVEGAIYSPFAVPFEVRLRIIS